MVGERVASTREGRERSRMREGWGRWYINGYQYNYNYDTLARYSYGYGPNQSGDPSSTIEGYCVFIARIHVEPRVVTKNNQWFLLECFDQVLLL
jgi:hypothetical protein